jgi:hypothetical protein
MLVNRVGDVGLALAICLIFLTFKTVDYSVAFALVPNVIDKTVTFFGVKFQTLTIISFFIVLRCFGQVCSTIITYMTTGCHGRPNARIRVNTCGHTCRFWRFSYYSLFYFFLKTVSRYLLLFQLLVR